MPTVSAAWGIDKFNFTQAGAGAVKRLGLDKFAECISVKDFGAHTTNEPGYSTFDSTAAIQATIEAVEAMSVSSQGKPRIYFPGGTYLITSTIRVKGSFICLYGDGHRATLLYKSGDFGDLLVFEAEDSSTTSIAACSVEGLALRAFSDTTSGALLRLTRAIESSFSELSLRDNFGGILVEGGIQLRFHNIEIRAGGLWSGVKPNSYMMKFKEGPAAQQRNPSEIFITNLNARNTGTSEQPWVEYGIHISCCDGIWISNGHTLACSLAGLFCEPAVTALSPSGTQLSGIIINNFWFDGHCKFGATFRGASPGYGGFIFNNTFFLNAHEYNFHVNVDCTASDFIFTGGECLKAGYSGMYLYGGGNIIVNGMNITGNGVLGTTGRAGVEVGNGVSNVLITGCRIGGTWLGTPTTQTSGVYINSSASDNINVSNNIFSGHSDANIRDTTSGKMKVYSDNVDDISYSGITASSNSLQIPMTGDYFEVASGVTLITNLISRNKKRRLTLLFTGACTVSNTANQLELSGSTNLIAKDKDTLSLIYTGTKWTEVSRSIK